MNRCGQKGVATVEFALISIILFTLILGIMEVGRVFFMLNTAVEATRLGARLAVVCDQSHTDNIKTKVVDLAGFLTSNDISITYPSSCSEEGVCDEFVTVEINDFTVKSIASLIPINFTMPKFSTTLPRESMSSESDINPICR